MYAIRSYYEFPFTDDNYYYETSGDNGYETYLLTLTDLDTKEKVTLDFSKFQYGEEYKKEDIDFIRITSYNVCYTKLLRIF